GNNDAVDVHPEKFTNRSVGQALVHRDSGVYSAVKLRTKVPTLNVFYEVEANPTDRPTDSTDANHVVTKLPGTTKTGWGADLDDIINVDGSVIASPSSRTNADGSITTTRKLHDANNVNVIYVEETIYPDGRVYTKVDQKDSAGHPKVWAERTKNADGSEVNLRIKKYETTDEVKDDEGHVTTPAESRVVWALEKKFDISPLTGVVNETDAYLYQGDYLTGIFGQNKNQAVVREYYKYSTWEEITTIESDEKPITNVTFMRESKVTGNYVQIGREELVIKYNANDASYSSAPTATGETKDTFGVCGDDVTLRPNGYARDGWQFVGWNDKANGNGTWYAERGVTSFAEDTPSVSGQPNDTRTVTLYAQWKPVAANDEAQITYMANYDGCVQVMQPTIGDKYVPPIQPVPEPPIDVYGETFYIYDSETSTYIQLNGEGGGLPIKPEPEPDPDPETPETPETPASVVPASADALKAAASDDTLSVMAEAPLADGENTGSEEEGVEAPKKTDPLTLEEIYQLQQGDGTTPGVKIYANAGDADTPDYKPVTMSKGASFTWTGYGYTFDVEPIDDSTISKPTITVAKSGFTRPGYQFIGWNTKPSGDGESYTVNEKAVLENNIVLYAQWLEDPNYVEPAPTPKPAQTIEDLLPYFSTVIYVWDRETEEYLPANLVYNSSTQTYTYVTLTYRSDWKSSTTRTVSFLQDYTDGQSTISNYVVANKTLAMVAQSDKNWAKTGWKYDPDVLETFNMDNDWINHETLFLPSGDTDAWQYNDTPWYAATILNSADYLDSSEYTDIIEAQGNVKHAKLVYAMHLPSQVTFYDEKKLTDDEALANQFSTEYQYIGDYEGDDYSFFVERTYFDRHDLDAAGKPKQKTERLTPKELMERGWTVKISYQSDNGDNSYNTSGVRDGMDNAHYGKPDVDDPLDTTTSRGLDYETGTKGKDAAAKAVKSRLHDREVVVFELAAPDDASDEEFGKYESLINGFYAGVHADGYLGYGESVTLKVKTRLDNLGAEENAIDESLFDETGALVSYKDQLNSINVWDADDATVYATVHETKLNWIEDNDEQGWDHIYGDNDLTDGDKNDNNGFGSDKDGNEITNPSTGTGAFKPKLKESLTIIGTKFHSQSMNRFFRAGKKTEDSRPDNIDNDRDGVLNDDLFVYETSGYLRIRKPSVSVRADSAALRSLRSSTDFGVELGGDAHVKGANNFYITQAINTGGAVNSFIVDWQVPYWCTEEGSVYDAPFEDPAMGVGRLNNKFESVSTGIWEVPGAQYQTSYSYKNQKIEFTNGKSQIVREVANAEGNGTEQKTFDVFLDGSGNVVYDDGTPVDSVVVKREPVAGNKEAEIEKNLRLFMFVRLASTNVAADQSGYNEQNGTEYQDHENYALAGTDADRDFFFGEDDKDLFGDSTDYNHADAQAWVQIGAPEGYAISDKHNVTIDADEFMSDDTMQVRQIRWVIKAVEPGKSYRDDTLSNKIAVPHGFRLDVDAMTDADYANVKNLDVSGKQEADDIDPLRNNVGWKVRTNTKNEVLYESNGTYQLDVLQTLTPGITNAAPLLKFRSDVSSSVNKMMAARYQCDSCGYIGEETGACPECDNGHMITREVQSEEAEDDVTVHLNHFVSATPRYDDTKYVEAERARAGIFRTPADPVLAIDITSGYFAGTGTTGYKWSTDNPIIDKDSSAMMRYRITLSNLSDDQMELLGFTGYDEDSCANPQISQLLPFCEGFGDFSLLNPSKFQYMDYAKYMSDTYDSSKYVSYAVYMNGEGIQGADGYVAPIYKGPRSYAEYREMLEGYTQDEKDLLNDKDWSVDGFTAYKMKCYNEYLATCKKTTGRNYAFFDWDYETKPNSRNPAMNLDAQIPVWTYYIVKMDETDKGLDPRQGTYIPVTNSASLPQMNNPQFGQNMKMMDKLVPPKIDKTITFMPIRLAHNNGTVDAACTSAATKLEFYKIVVQADNTITYVPMTDDEIKSSVGSEVYVLDGVNYVAVELKTLTKTDNPNYTINGILRKKGETLNGEVLEKDTAENGVKLEDGDVVYGYEKVTESESEASTIERKYATWGFTGKQLEGKGSPERGILSPGYSIVIEYLMPISSDNSKASNLISNELRKTKALGYKPGEFEGYTLNSDDNSGKTRGLESDDRDANLDGVTDQSMIVMELNPIQFTTAKGVGSTKTASSQLDKNVTRSVHGPAAVPEGTTYSYSSSAVNNDDDKGSEANYRNIVLYDILPFENDTQIYNGDGKRGPLARESQWNGWIDDLDSIEVRQFSADEESIPTEGRLLKNAELDPETGEPVKGAEVQIWVGPYKTETRNGITHIRNSSTDDLLWLYNLERYEQGGKTYPVYRDDVFIHYPEEGDPVILRKGVDELPESDNPYIPYDWGDYVVVSTDEQGNEILSIP
ncbi:MAG: InlB B-repeat-containing protein, partial [Adlercreutzia sp.]|nr:InlB B-repeat-containing protein [Adlercreutzia sp.]